MKKNLLIIRIFFALISLFGCFLIWYYTGAWDFWQVFFVGMSISALVILTDLISWPLTEMSGLSHQISVTRHKAEPGWIYWLKAANGQERTSP